MTTAIPYSGKNGRVAIVDGVRTPFGNAVIAAVLAEAGE